MKVKIFKSKFSFSKFIGLMKFYQFFISKKDPLIQEFSNNNEIIVGVPDRTDRMSNLTFSFFSNFCYLKPLNVSISETCFFSKLGFIWDFQ